MSLRQIVCGAAFAAVSAATFQISAEANNLLMTNTQTNEFVSLVPNMGGAIRAVELLEPSKKFLYRLLKEPTPQDSEIFLNGQHQAPWTGLSSKSFVFQNKTYNFPNNVNFLTDGMIKQNNMAVLSKFANDNEATVELLFQFSNNTTPYFPFDLDVRFTYQLAAGGFTVTTEVSNKGKTDAPFSYGVHPCWTLDSEHYEAEESIQNAILTLDTQVNWEATYPTFTNVNCNLGCRIVGNLNAAKAWQPDDNTGRMKRVSNLWTVTFPALAPGNYEYRLSVNGSWNESYGFHGMPGGSNISMTVGGKSQQSVSFYFDPSMKYNSRKRLYDSTTLNPMTTMDPLADFGTYQIDQTFQAKAKEVGSSLPQTVSVTLTERQSQLEVWMDADAFPYVQIQYPNPDSIYMVIQPMTSPHNALANSPLRINPGAKWTGRWGVKLMHTEVGDYASPSEKAWLYFGYMLLVISPICGWWYITRLIKQSNGSRRRAQVF